MQAHPGLLTVGPAERPSSSPRPDIGEVHADGVLLVWKPVESYGPVTYIVQCSLEGVGPSRTRHSWGKCGALLNPPLLGVPESLWAEAGGWGPAWPLCAPLGPLHPDRQWAAAAGLPLTHSCVAQAAAGTRWPRTSLTAATSPASCPGVGRTPSGRPASARRAWAPTAAPRSRSSWEGPAAWVSPWAGLCGNAPATAAGPTLTWGGSFCPLGPSPTTA